MRAVSFLLFLLLVELCNGGMTSGYIRGPDLPNDMPLDSDVFTVPSGPNTPQQVHITQGNHEGNGVIISWVTPVRPGSNTVRYWYENRKPKSQAEATVNTYRFFNYTSGYIHHCIIDDLQERVSNIAYNIVNGLCEPIIDESALVYITIGDGGNSEGLETDMIQPQPSFSAFREASFGHGLLRLRTELMHISAGIGTKMSILLKQILCGCLIGFGKEQRSKISDTQWNFQ